MISSLRQLKLRRDLLIMLTWREVVIKYKQSVMGLLWAVLMPTLIVSAGILVKYAYSSISKVPLTVADIASVAVKSVPWAFFVAAVRFSATSLVANANLVTKIYTPREVFPLTAILSQLVDFAIASVILVVLLGVMGVGVSVHLLWVPVLVAALVLLAIAIGLFVSAAGLFFRDVKYLVEVFVTFAIFFTPVFFDADMFGKWKSVVLLNPVAPILEGLTAAVVKHRAPEAGWLLYSVLCATIGIVLSYRFFTAVEPYFAERA